MPRPPGRDRVREAVSRAGVGPADVGHAVFGNVIHTGQDMYLARVAALRGGLAVETPALTLNRLCGSGLQAIITAANAIANGDCEAAIGGGAESMSRAPYWLPAMRWGARLNDAKAVDTLVAAVTDPFDEVHMGCTAENVARRWSISREDQDAWAVESHQRAVAAAKAGRFADQIIPIELKSKAGVTQFMTDEGPRADATLENLARLKPAFDNEGTVTAGNASSINDGAAAVMLASGSCARSQGLAPLGRLIAYSHAGVGADNHRGFGPCVRKVLHGGLKVDEIDVFEVNEAFAAQALAVIRELEAPGPGPRTPRSPRTCRSRRP